MFPTLRMFCRPSLLWLHCCLVVSLHWFLHGLFCVGHCRICCSCWPWLLRYASILNRRHFAIDKPSVSQIFFAFTFYVSITRPHGVTFEVHFSSEFSALMLPWMSLLNKKVIEPVIVELSGIAQGPVCAFLPHSAVFCSRQPGSSNWPQRDL
jgi:hypothetical protein